MGTPDFSVPTLEALVDAGYEVAGVFTQPDRPRGRGGKVQMSPVKELALRLGIPVFQPLKIRADGLEPLRALAPDVCVTAAFGQILSQEVLDVPCLGTVNVHASLLPRHRGAAPELSARLSQLGAELLIETLRLLEAGDCPREKQDEALATYDPKVDKEMGRLDFAGTTRECVNRVRAMSPWPCAFVPLAEGALKVWSAAAVEGASGVPGTVLRADKRDGLVVATADGALSLLEVQAPNARRMDAKAFLLGHPIPEGTMLDEVRL